MKITIFKSTTKFSPIQMKRQKPKLNYNGSFLLSTATISEFFFQNYQHMKAKRSIQKSTSATCSVVRSRGEGFLPLLHKDYIFSLSLQHQPSKFCLTTPSPILFEIAAPFSF
jgi:hypothetical protein